jgi:aspartate kinase
MTIVVRQYGADSLGSIDCMRGVARNCISAQRAGVDVVVIVSARHDATTRLLELVGRLTKTPDARELDVLKSTGDHVLSTLVALAIQAEGGRARSFVGHQVRVVTDSAFSQARIKVVESARISAALSSGEIAVVAGLQGIDDNGDITTVGDRADAVAVAVAAALGARCEVYDESYAGIAASTQTSVHGGRSMAGPIALDRVDPFRIETN